eukprot:2101749-Rhodomonas_salina.3
MLLPDPWGLWERGLQVGRRGQLTYLPTRMLYDARASHPSESRSALLSAYALARRCPVLTQRMVLLVSAYARTGIGKAYGATGIGLCTHLVMRRTEEAYDHTALLEASYAMCATELAHVLRVSSCTIRGTGLAYGAAVIYLRDARFAVKEGEKEEEANEEAKEGGREQEEQGRVEREEEGEGEEGAKTEGKLGPDTTVSFASEEVRTYSPIGLRVWYVYGLLNVVTAYAESGTEMESSMVLYRDMGSVGCGVRY